MKLDAPTIHDEQPGDAAQVAHLNKLTFGYNEASNGIVALQNVGLFTRRQGCPLARALADGVIPY